jgi:molybdate transport system regulatory protein
LSREAFRGQGSARSHDPADTRFRIRLIFGAGAMMGPSKAELLGRISQTCSIAAAGRQMGMSYRRASQLVETMNAMFREPLVHSTRGGPRDVGAVTTETRQAVLAFQERSANAPMPFTDSMRVISAGSSGQGSAAK